MDNLEQLEEQIKENQQKLLNELEKVFYSDETSAEEKKKIEKIINQNKLLSLALENKDIAQINNIYNTLLNADNDR